MQFVVRRREEAWGACEVEAGVDRRQAAYVQDRQRLRRGCDVAYQGRRNGGAANGHRDCQTSLRHYGSTQSRQAAVGLAAEHLVRPCGSSGRAAPVETRVGCRPPTQ